MPSFCFSLGANELVVDHGLSAGLDASDVVAHRVHAGLARVDLNDNLERLLASLELLLPVSALGLAFLENIGLRVLAQLKLCLDVARGVDMRSKALIIDHPSGCKPASDSASHFFSFDLKLSI